MDGNIGYIKNGIIQKAYFRNMDIWRVSMSMLAWFNYSQDIFKIIIDKVIENKDYFGWFGPYKNGEFFILKEINNENLYKKITSSSSLTEFKHLYPYGIAYNNKPESVRYVEGATEYYSFNAIGCININSQREDEVYPKNLSPDDIENNDIILDFDNNKMIVGDYDYEVSEVKVITIDLVNLKINSLIETIVTDDVDDKYEYFGNYYNAYLEELQGLDINRENLKEFMAQAIDVIDKRYSLKKVKEEYLN